MTDCAWVFNGIIGPLFAGSFLEVTRCGLVVYCYSRTLHANVRFGNLFFDGSIESGNKHAAGAMGGDDTANVTSDIDSDYSDIAEVHRV